MADEKGTASNPWRHSDFTTLTYTNADGVEVPYPMTRYANTTVVQNSDGDILDEDEYDKDMDVGFTNPNLHRRVDVEYYDGDINPNILDSESDYYNSQGFLVYRIPLLQDLIIGQTYTLQLWDVHLVYTDEISGEFKDNIFFSWGNFPDTELTLEVTGGYSSYLKLTFVVTSDNRPSEYTDKWVYIYGGIPAELEPNQRFVSIGQWKLEQGDSATPLYKEIAPKQYELEIHGTNSYRTTTITTHDEESTTTEIP